MGEVVPLSRLVRRPELPPAGYRLVVMSPTGERVFEYPLPNEEGGDRPYYQAPPAGQWGAVLRVMRWAYLELARSE